jgi:hypoxanthine phosphoribosyltransferase
VTAKPKPVLTPAELAARVAQMGKAISRDYAGRKLDVVVILENAFMFGADLVRHIQVPLVCHFVRAEMRDVKLAGFERREIFFSHEPDLRDRDVLVLETVLHSGVTLDFLCKRLQNCHPRSLRVAVLIDKPQERKVDLAPDYCGFELASKFVMGYGLPGSQGLWRNLPYVASQNGAGRSRAAGRRAKKGKSKR